MVWFVCYPATFKKAGLWAAMYPAGLPKSDKRNVDECLAIASTIFQKVLESPWRSRTPVHESFQETCPCGQATANQDGFQGQHHATA